MKLTITGNTYLKAFPINASRLRENGLPDQLIEVKEGTELEIVEHFAYEGDPDSEGDDHVFVQLAQPMPASQGLRWFLYSLHIQIEGVEPKNDPQDESAPEPQASEPEDTGPKISLPGINRQVGINEPIYTGSNFTWREMTKAGARIPINADITQRIIKLSKYLDEVRTFLGEKPMVITSGYRDPITNKRVGGASRSRHMQGDAVDFYVRGVDVVDTFNTLKKYHTKGGLAVGKGFVHIDLRPGGPVRWTYPKGPKVNLW